MNAFARSNLAVALLRLNEARERARLLLSNVPDGADRYAVQFLSASCEGIDWTVREAIRLIENAAAIDDMESVDTLPSPPESGVKGAVR